MKAASDMDLDHPLAGEEKAADELPKLTPSEELSRKDLESAEDLVGEDLPVEKIKTPKNEKGERIYYDMTLVVPTDALPAKLGIKLCGNQIYGAFVLNRRVDLAIDAT